MFCVQACVTARYAFVWLLFEQCLLQGEARPMNAAATLLGLSRGRVQYMVHRASERLGTIEAARELVQAQTNTNDTRDVSSTGNSRASVT